MAKTNQIKEAEVTSTISKSEAFFAKNKKAIIIALAAIIIAIVGIVLYNTYVAEPREAKASTALAKGQEYFMNQQFDIALNGDKKDFVGFAKFADEYSGTDAANLAHLYAGICYENLGKHKEAVDQLEDFSTEGDMMISPAAKMKLGDAYANLKQYDDAVSAFKKAASLADKAAQDGINNTISPIALKKAGAVLESQKKFDEALSIYKDIKAKYLNSAVASDIDKYIERAQNSK